MNKLSEMAIEKVIDGILNLSMDMSIDEIKKILAKGKNQKMLLKSFQAAVKYLNSEAEKSICGVSDEQIAPNLSLKELKSNLRDIFQICIIADDENESSEIQDKICLDYKRRAAATLELSHILENQQLNNVKLSEGMECNGKSIDLMTSNTKAIAVQVKELNSKLKQEPKIELHFIDELESSRMFCYINLRLTEHIPNSIYEEFEKNLGWGMENEEYEDEQGFQCLNLNFFEPNSQAGVRDVLRALDETLPQYNIGILGIYTHK
ncbi:MAG: hypothetical protein RSF33_05990 [Hydrogenoanaerobacterium sp.]